MTQCRNSVCLLYLEAWEGYRCKLLNNSCETFSGTFRIKTFSISNICLLVHYFGTISVAFSLIKSLKHLLFQMPLFGCKQSSFRKIDRGVG